jgi:hypothetical protein
MRFFICKFGLALGSVYKLMGRYSLVCSAALFLCIGLGYLLYLMRYTKSMWTALTSTSGQVLPNSQFLTGTDCTWNNFLTFFFSTHKPCDSLTQLEASLRKYNLGSAKAVPMHTAEKTPKRFANIMLGIELENPIHNKD